MKKQAYNLVSCQPTLQRLNHTVDEYDYYVNVDFCEDPKLSEDEIDLDISRVGVEEFCNDEKFVWEDLPDNRKLQTLVDWSAFHESVTLPVKTYEKEA